MKQFFLTLYALAAIVLTAVAQPRFTSNTEEYHLGQVEWKHPATVQYIITNTGNEPLVLADIQPDCACTAVQWTQTPITPGGKGTVGVTFDAEALGTFHKSVAIYTNAQPHLVYLSLTGKVVREITDFTLTHPYLIGQIRLDCNTLDFPDVEHGEHPVMHISVVNLSPYPYEPVLMHLPSYLDMQVEPAVLQEGEKGIITLTLNSGRLTGFGLIQSSVYLSRFAGDKVSDENEIPVSAVLLPDFSGLTETERAQAPSITLSDTKIDLAETLSRKLKAHRDITITNRGRSPLHISKLQVFHPAISARLKKDMLQPGESISLRVTVSKKDIGKKRRQLRLLMITNDPSRPKVEIDIQTKS